MNYVELGEFSGVAICVPTGLAPTMLGMSKFRFSIRLLLIVTTVSACGFFWFGKPTLIANQYMRAIEQGQFGVANEICIGDVVFPGDYAFEGFTARSSLKPFTFQDLVAGRREMVVAATAFKVDGVVHFGSPLVVSASVNLKGVKINRVTVPDYTRTPATTKR